MRNLYVTPDEAQERLLAARLFTLETLPSLEDLEYWLTIVQAEMDNWLNQSLLPTLYTDTVLANYLGAAVIPRSPVQEVQSVDAIIMQIGQPRQMLRVMPIWQGSETILGLSPYQKYEVSYISGFDPVPQIVQQVAFNLLKKVMIQGVDLNERTRYLSNVGLQGGLSQTFQIGAEPRNARSSRNIDDLMLSLEKYRKKIWT
jgi:hypothetical protein